MRIIAFGDVHMDLGNFEQIPEIQKADLVVITGDLTKYGSRKDAKEVLDKVMRIKTNVLALHGNLDKPDVGDYLEEQGLSLHGTGRAFDSFGIFGVGGSNRTPFNTPTEFAEEELAGLLNSGYEKVKRAENLVLVSHAPPFNTKTDVIRDGTHVGSTALREFIEKKQPALCITGHIHESRAEDVIGRTRILNPGKIKDGGWIEIQIEQGAVRAALKG